MTTISQERRTDAAAGAPLPMPRGPVSRWVLRRLQGRPVLANPPPSTGDPLDDGDLHLALHCLGELTYRSLRDVDPAAERDPLLVALRTRLEDELLDAVRAETQRCDAARWEALARSDGPQVAVDVMVDAFDGPSLSRFMEERGTVSHFREFMIHRSAYQLKEADPHTFGLARLPSGRRKSAYAEVQFDEYGNGEPGATHAELFAAAMRRAGLDDRYGSAIDQLPGVTLATSNLLNLFAGRRELLGELVGHLALFEMTSVVPMGRYARAADRLQLGPEVRAFYDVHVVADAHHGELARHHLLGDLADADGLDPAALVFGAHALLCVEDRFARTLLDAWARGLSSLDDAPPHAVEQVRPTNG
jgi:hypothetical protein